MSEAERERARERERDGDKVDDTDGERDNYLPASVEEMNVMK